MFSEFLNFQILNSNNYFCILLSYRIMLCRLYQHYFSFQKIKDKLVKDMHQRLLMYETILNKMLFVKVKIGFPWFEASGFLLLCSHRFKTWTRHQRLSCCSCKVLAKGFGNYFYDLALLVLALIFPIKTSINMSL